MLIRGLYYEGWCPSAERPRPRMAEDFLAPIAEAFRDDLEAYPDGVAWAVFTVLGRHISAGEIADVLHVIPEDIRYLWAEGIECSPPATRDEASLRRGSGATKAGRKGVGTHDEVDSPMSSGQSQSGMTTLVLEERERGELLQLLEQSPKETRVEVHHTYTPDFRE